MISSCTYVDDELHCDQYYGPFGCAGFWVRRVRVMRPGLKRGRCVQQTLFVVCIGVGVVCLSEGSANCRSESG